VDKKYLVAFIAVVINSTEVKLKKFMKSSSSKTLGIFGTETAVSNREKAEIIARASAKIYGSYNLSEEERRRR